MTKKREIAEDESVVITNGQRRYIKRGEIDPEVNEPGKTLPQEAKIVHKKYSEEINKILTHELYTKLQGKDRTDGILTDLLAENLIDEKTHKKLTGTDLKLETVEDVQKLINKEVK